MGIFKYISAVLAFVLAGCGSAPPVATNDDAVNTDGCERSGTSAIPSLTEIAALGNHDFTIPSGTVVTSVLVLWFSLDPGVGSPLVTMFSGGSGAVIGGYRAAGENPGYEPLVPGTDKIKIGNQDETRPIFVSVAWCIR